MYWRAAIAKDDLFDNLSIPEELLETLRSNLMDYKSQTPGDFRQLLTQKPDIKVFPFSMTTAASFEDETANSLFAAPAINPWVLNVDRFHFALFAQFDDIPKIDPDFLRNESNTKIEDCKMMVFSALAWHAAVITPPINMVVQNAKSSDDARL